MKDNTLYTPTMAFHPGETLQEKLEELRLTNDEFATQSGVPAFVVEEILAGNMSVSADMAIAFEQTTKIPAAWWLTAQHTYDEYALRTRDDGYKTRLSNIGAQLSRIAASIML